MKDKYIYPAIFEYDEDGINITFPDLPGCITCGDNDEEALYMAKDALGGFLYAMEEENDFIPDPTPLKEIRTNEKQKAVLIEIWMPTVRKAVENKSVKKTLTIPQWLNRMAMEEDINFSFILQEALKKELRLK
ncbi:MAG: type II toxin-antitoxin system HicB family antitoxin [Bacillota bacterium]